MIDSNVFKQRLKQFFPKKQIQKPEEKDSQLQEKIRQLLKKKNTVLKERYHVVRERRVELLQVLPHRLLRPARLPIPPLAHEVFLIAGPGKVLIVPRARFELARVFPPPPQDGASTNFATWAIRSAKLIKMLVANN